MMVDWIATVMQIAPAMRPEEVIAMDALLAIELVASRARAISRSQAQQREQQDAATSRPGRNGTRSVEINSMDAVRKLLSGGFG